MKQVDLAMADKIISNQLYLLRFTAGEVKKVKVVLTQMQKELTAKLSTDLTDFAKARVNKLLKETTAIIDTYYSDLQTQLDLTGIAKHEATATTGTMTTIGLDASMPTAAVLKAMLSETLLQGAPLSAWWAKQAEDTAFKFAAQVRQGIVQGETLQQIITRVVGSPKKGITGIMDVSRRNASTLVHDSIMQISNDAKMATYQENSDILNGVQWLATFDSHICIECANRSGAQWDLEGNPINGTTLPFVTPPLHPNCPCLLTGVTKSYKELGLDISGPERTGTRASDLGQIKADTSFDSFLKRHDAAYQNELLGKGRAELYRSGKLTLKDLTSGSGRPLTLAQLQAAA